MTDAERLKYLERARKASARKRMERRQNAPERLSRVERAMDDLGARYRVEPEKRAEIRAELRDLGRQRELLLWGENGLGREYARI